MNQLVLVGLSHKTAPIEVRERVAFQDRRIVQSHQELVRQCGLKESMILSTCNRVEILARDGQPSRAIQAIQDFLHRHHSLPAGTLDGYLYALRSRPAVSHLFRVAGSLDSMVIGESQILGQLKESYQRARETGYLGKSLQNLLPQAFFVAKRIRNETGVGQSAVSVSSVAVELSERIFGDMTGKSVLLVGAGKMAELAARHFIDRGATGVAVCNRTSRTSEQLAGRLQGRAVPFEDLKPQLLSTDVALISTSADGYLLERSSMEQIIRQRKYRPLFLIDIGVPRNVDPSIKDIESVFLFDIDDLQAVAEANMTHRKRSARSAERIVEEEVDKFFDRRSLAQVGPLAEALRARFEELCMADFEPLAKGMTETEKERLRRRLLRSAHRLAHPLIVEVRNINDPRKRSRQIDTLSRVYRLDLDK